MLFSSQRLSLFALNTTRDLGEKVGSTLGIHLSQHEEREFEDGEHKARPLESVRGRDVYVIQSLYDDPSQSVNDKLCRLLFFLGALRDASAERITVVAPYLCYARKDRKSKSRDPVTSRYLARLFEAMKVDRLVTIDVHNLSAFQNAFSILSEHLETRSLLIEQLAPLLAEDEVTVVSPDFGGLKRARPFRDALSQTLDRPIPLGLMEKTRSSGIVSGDELYGDVHRRTVLILDDLISSGSTILRAARKCRECGASRVIAAATHGLFVNAEQTLNDAALDQILVTNTVPPFRLSPSIMNRKVQVIDVSGLLATAIQRMHSNGSLVDDMVIDGSAALDSSRMTRLATNNENRFLS